MEKAGISEKLIKLAEACVGHIRGGLAIVCVIVACFFAAISGSGPATVAALGVIIVPAMIKSGYKPAFSAALMAAAGAIGVIIPPSITFVVYGSIADTSIGDLFIAGLLPGIIMGIGLMIVALVVGRKSDLKTLPKASKKERWAAFKDAFWGLMMPVIILGGIYGGIFTPTEAAAVSVVYGLFVGVFIYKKIRFKEFYAIPDGHYINHGDRHVYYDGSQPVCPCAYKGKTRRDDHRRLENATGGSVIIFFYYC